jgi:hypothetical protein
MALIPVELPWTKTEVLEGTSVGELFDAGPTEDLDVVAACVNRRVVALDFRSSARAASSPSTPLPARGRRS